MINTWHCAECDGLIVETENGYTRGCQHYPVAEMNKFVSNGDRRLRKKVYDRQIAGLFWIAEHFDSAVKEE